MRKFVLRRRSSRGILMIIVNYMGSPNSHTMMPVGLIRILQVLQDIEYILFPPCNVFWRLDLSSPWGSLKSLSPFSRLKEKSAYHHVVIIGAMVYYRQCAAMNKFMDNGHQLEVRLKNRIGTTIPSLGKGIDGVDKRIQDTIDINAPDTSPNRLVTAEHFPEAFAQHIMVSNTLSALRRDRKSRAKLTTTSLACQQLLFSVDDLQSSRRNINRFL